MLALWRSGRVAEGAPLLRVYTLIAYRGFESLLLRHIPKCGFSWPRQQTKKHYPTLLTMIVNRTEKWQRLASSPKIEGLF